MLAIISDLHLTDGTSGEIISDSAFRLFKNRIGDMAYDASWRCKNKVCKRCMGGNECEKYYEPISNLDIILLGDILDMIRSEKWNDAPESIMPWSEKSNRTDTFFAKVDEIVTDILEFNKSSFNVLKGMSVDNDIRIPKSMSPASAEKMLSDKVNFIASEEKVNVKVNIYYMIGNHDWFLFIDDKRMVPIRNKVIDALGLANDRDIPFPYFRSDSKKIETLQNNHRVFAEHGDEFDPTNFSSPNRDGSSIGDAVVIRILNAIPHKAKKHLDKYRDDKNNEEMEIFIKELHEIDNLRPYTLAPDWISQLIIKTKLKKNIVDEAIGETLHEVIDDFIKSSIISEDLKLKIKMWLVKLILPRKLNISLLGTILDHTSLSKDKPESYRKFAIGMAEKHDLDFFIMGHTHYAEIVPLNRYVDKQTGETRNKIYLNTGTWRKVHFKGQTSDDFISFKTMTIAGFYKDNERKGRNFEFWTGSLSV